MTNSETQQRLVTLDRNLTIGMTAVAESEIVKVTSIQILLKSAYLTIEAANEQTTFEIHAARNLNGFIYVALSDPPMISADSPLLCLHIVRMHDSKAIQTITEGELTAIQSHFEELKLTRRMPISQIEAALTRV